MVDPPFHIERVQGRQCLVVLESRSDPQEDLFPLTFPLIRALAISSKVRRASGMILRISSIASFTSAAKPGVFLKSRRTPGSTDTRQSESCQIIGLLDLGTRLAARLHEASWLVAAKILFG